MQKLKAPFPWFGGKSRAAHLVWERFGDVPNYVEPFAGSLAVLLGRPTPPRIETVNDIDAYVSNFWRAVQHDPAGVAEWADWPVNEIDMHARHRWLVEQPEFREKMRADPDFFDAKIAGWWVWGICQWIGSGWCSVPEWSGRIHIGGHDRGVATVGAQLHQKRPILRRGGRGVTSHQKPNLRGDSGAAGMGIHASAITSRLPNIDARGGKGIHGPQSEAILTWMLALRDRLRLVRVACGDWMRVLGRSSTELAGVTGVLLDPPYANETGRAAGIYAHNDAVTRVPASIQPALFDGLARSLSEQVREWAIDHGENPKMRIALCGLEGEHEMPDTWSCVPWKAQGGYAAAAGNHENAKRERIWFSPHCLTPQTSTNV
jgi:DNA adenine methylase